MGALDDVRVVEAGLLVQGPQAAATLGDWGAEVVKVELPGFGDQARWLPIAPGDTRSAYFIACNRGKRSVTVDLRRPSGREVFLRLCEWADIVITNFKPGTMEEWGLSYEEVAERNPRVIYASGSTFGPLGPDRAKEGADLSGQAAGGVISTIGEDGSPASPIGATFADHIASQNLVGGILAALYARERTGSGQHVSTSLLGGQIWAQASELTSHLLNGRGPGRANRGNPMVPGLYGIFSTSDGSIAIVGVVGPSREAFFKLIGRPELIDEFSQLLYSEEDKRALFPRIDEALTVRPTSDWCEVFSAAGIRHAPVRDYESVVTDAGVWDNGYLTHGGDPEGVLVASPVRFSGTPARTGERAPELGEHTEEVLLELGFSWEEISTLSDEKAI